MKLIAAAQHLENQHFGVQGVDIFINDMPLDCQLGVVLRDRLSGTKIDHYMPGYRVADFQAAVRSREMVAGRDYANALVERLTITRDVELPGVLIKQMLPQNDPRPYRRSAGAFFEWEVDVDIVYVLTARLASSVYPP